jgi:hypothetical protein
MDTDPRIMCLSCHRHSELSRLGGCAFVQHFLSTSFWLTAGPNLMSAPRHGFSPALRRTPRVRNRRPATRFRRRPLTKEALSGGHYESFCPGVRILRTARKQRGRVSLGGRVALQQRSPLLHQPSVMLKARGKLEKGKPSNRMCVDLKLFQPRNSPQKMCPILCLPRHATTGEQ